MDGIKSRPVVLGILLSFLPGGTSGALEIIVGLPCGNHRIGHTAGRVKTFDQDQEVIYDLGRYGRRPLRAFDGHDESRPPNPRPIVQVR
jgi:hypothetical protein